MSLIDSLFPKPPEEIKADIAGLTQEISRLEGDIKNRLATSSLKPEEDPAQSNYRARLQKARADLAELKTLQAALGPDVALKSQETAIPLIGAGGNGASGGALGFGQPAVPVPAPPPPAEIPAPDMGPYKQAMDQLPAMTAAAMGEAAAAAAAGVGGIAEGLNGGTAVITAVVGAWPGIMQASLSSLYAIGNAAGSMIGKGLVDGMVAQIGNVTAAGNALAMAAKAGAEGGLEINSPSKVFIGIGESVGEGLGVGMENGFQPVLDQAKELSGQISDAFNSGGDPTDLLKGYTDDETSRMGKVLNFQSHRLTTQAKSLDKQFKATGEQKYKDQADSIRSQIDTLSEQKDSLSLASEYADLTNPKKNKSGDSNPFVASIKELMKMPGAFATASAQQTMQDLNIGGNGALESIVGFGMDFAQKGITNIFNTSNVDDTIALHQNHVNRQAQGVDGR